MKRVKMIALGMAVIVGGLTACGSAKEATTCKTAYAENGQYYVYVDRTSDWGKSVFKDNKLEDKINKDATAEDVGSQLTKCEDKEDPEYSHIIYSIKGHEDSKIKLQYYTNVKMEEKYSYVISHDDYVKYDGDEKKLEQSMPAWKKEKE